MKDVFDEELVLRPVDPAISDDNKWPNFEVTQAEVCNEATGCPESLLAAGDELRLVVTGRLERLERGQSRHLVTRGSLPTSVRVKNVQRFSYGQYPDGSVAFWAAGKAGWFEIHPSRQYRHIYKDMTDAINLLYFAADFYRGMKPKKLRETSLQTLFYNYAQDATFDCEDELMARAAYLRHRLILRTMMSEGKEDIDWRQTQLFRFLDRDLSDDVDAVRQPGTPDRASDDDDDDDDDDNFPSRLAGKGKSALRPKAESSLSGKAAARQAAQARIKEPDSDNDSHADLSESPPPKRKNASISEPSVRKRGRPTRRKGRRNLGDDSETDQQAVRVAASRGAVSNILGSTMPSKLSLPNTVPSPRFELDVIECPLPSFAPNQPGNIWACGFDGCSHRVFAATTDQSQELIKDHYKRHAHVCQSAIDVVQREERPYLPVDHLLKRIREVASQKDPAPEKLAADGRSSIVSSRYKTSEPAWLKEVHNFPQPIRQKY